MNYLAHFYLSSGSEGLIIGNFIADFVKGNKYLDYPPPVSEGILFHREIDRYTDQHPVVMETKKRLYPAYGKYAGVIVDIYYDHILAAHWKEHSTTPLKSFSGEIYSLLSSNFATLPAAAQFTLKYMAQYDWLSNYASLQGVSRTFEGLSRRTSFESHMENATRELKRDYQLIKEEFNSFFPSIEMHLREFRKD